MEAAPLVKAYDHAKAASEARALADSTVAINEHALAAGEFSNATKSTTSIEALRVLKLLEDHHRKLSGLLQFSAEHPLKQRGDEAEKSRDGAGEDDVVDEKVVEAVNATESGQKKDVRQSKSSSDATSLKPTDGTLTATQSRRYPPPRELSSSIASNLASARGIKGGGSRYRGQALTPSVSTEQAGGSSGTRDGGSKSRMRNMLEQPSGISTTSGKPGWVPPSPAQVAAGAIGRMPPSPSRSNSGDSSLGEDGYSRFYNTFGGIISKLSAPLAFAGLPLISEESTTLSEDTSGPAATTSVKTPSSSSRMPKTVSANPDEPDLTAIYSRAALQAVTRGQHNPSESFYVVPTSGGTVSYANILNFDQKEKRRSLAASVHGDMDDDAEFVDARETLLPPPSRYGVKMGSQYQQHQHLQHKTTTTTTSKTPREKELANTVEELRTQNSSLKDMLDKVSKRLHAFEASAQHSRLLMADSMRLARPGSPMSSSGTSGGGLGQQQQQQTASTTDSTNAVVLQMRKRVQQLEEEVAAGQSREMHMEKTLEKYRARWMDLKKGAKARRDAQGSSVGAADG